jgi:micrococcal nuclease
MYTYSCTITKIIDGDTVDVDIDLGFSVVLRNQRVRLYGCDTPESRTRDLVERRYGFAAKRYVAAFLPVGSYAKLVSHDKGKFGRILGEFIVFNPLTESVESLKDIMIREHIAVAYHGQSKDDIEEEHIINRELINERYLQEE